MADRARHRLRSCAFAAVALGALACSEPTVAADATDVEAFAFDPRLIVSDDAGGVDTIAYHWPRGRQVSLYVAAGASSGGHDLESAVEAAMSAWRDVLWFGELGFRRASTPRDADIVVQDIDAAPLTADPGCNLLNGFGGVTSFCASETLDSLLVLPLVEGGGGRVKFAITIDGSRAASRTQFLGVVAHEIGHAIGLGSHSPDPTDLMSGIPVTAVPSNQDGRVIRWLMRQPIDLRP